MMRSRSLDEFLGYLPTVEKRAQNTWTRDFAASLRMQSRRRNWKPSEKQIGIVHRLVSDFFVHLAKAEGDAHVIAPD